MLCGEHRCVSDWCWFCCCDWFPRFSLHTASHLCNTWMTLWISSWFCCQLMVLPLSCVELPLAFSRISWVIVLFSFLNALVWDWRLLLSELMVNRKANLLRSLQFLFPFPFTIAFVFCLLLRIQSLTLIKCQWGAMSQVLASRPPLWGFWLVKKNFNFSSRATLLSVVGVLACSHLG